VSARQRRWLAALQEEDGMVTAFVVVIVMALVLVAGLVLDGGLALAAKVQAIDDAQAAARAGAQAIDLPTYRATGQITLDAATATTDAEQSLTTAGQSGTVNVAGDVVTVTVTVTQHTQILDLIGVNALHETATGSATAEQEAP
jgi:hypothetical protein